MPFLSVEDLAERLNDPDCIVVDCRWKLADPDHGRRAYADGHIPNAVLADLESDLSADTGPGRHPLPSPSDFDAFLGAIGATPRSSIVAYDDANGAIAARLWWMLTDQGHEQAFILDGGLPAWVGSGRSLSTETIDRHAPKAAGIATRPWRGVVTADDVNNRQPGTMVVDARSSDRYRGDHEPVDARPGHIPGAINLPHTGNVDDGRFKDASRLRDRFHEAGIDPASDVIMHCGSGVTACSNIAAMVHAGLPRPDLYVGSWSDWASTDLPAKTGDAP